MSAPAQELLKISELAEQADVPVATVRHYLREGLLPEPVKTSRNMAYYPPQFVDRIRLIKQLQEERFMPLRVIRDLLENEDAEPGRLRAMIELEDRILERALAGERERIPAEEVRGRYEVPEEVLDRLAELEVLTQRLAGDVDPDRAVELIEAGSGPLNDLIAALHTKLLVAELERHGAGRTADGPGRLSDRP